jgi:hypothetical protein
MPPEEWSGGIAARHHRAIQTASSNDRIGVDCGGQPDAAASYEILSDVDLFRDRQRIINLDPQIAHLALQLGMAQQ